MAQLGHKNRLCDAWSCASFGNKDKHNQIAGTRLRKFHRSCNTDEYIFSFRSKMLNLWNSILSSAQSVLLLHMVLYSIWIREWMTEPTDCRGKGRKTWRGVYSTNFIQFQPHHLHIYVESGISRWRNTSGVAPSTFTGADSVIFSDFVCSKYRCPRHLLSGPQKCFLRQLLLPRCMLNYQRVHCDSLNFCSWPSLCLLLVFCVSCV